MKNLKIAIITIIFLTTTSYLFAADAVIKSLAGKVETQEQGSSSWKSAALGQKLKPGTIISTGFNSNVVLDLGSSEIIVRPLTRISLNELTERGGIVKTDLNLKLGKITADVKTTEGLKHDFTLKTPVSTAAVRGTKFTAGINNITVQQGRIAYSNNIGQRRMVPAGSSSVVSSRGFGTPQSAGQAATQGFTVPTSTSTDNAGKIVPKGKDPTGTVIIRPTIIGGNIGGTGGVEIDWGTDTGTVTVTW